MIGEKGLDAVTARKIQSVDENLHSSLLEFRSFTSAFAVILLTLISAFLMQHLGGDFKSRESVGAWGGILILASGIGAAVYFRRQLFLILTSYQFAVSVLSASALAVILGTFVIQHAAEAEYIRLYGRMVTAFIYSFFLYDLFHSFWFSSLLVLTASSLFLVLFKRNPFRTAQLGFLLSHGGIILILAGAMTGYFYSETGMIHLVEGTSESSMAIVKNGVYTGEKRNLGFDLKLQDFQVDYYAGESKIYAYRLDSGKGQYLAVGSYDLEQGRQYKIPGSGVEIRIGAVKTGNSTTAEIETAGEGTPMNAIVTNNGDVPLYLNNGQVLLTIDKRDQEVKEYRSLVSIVENGAEQRREIIQVNHPLKYNGFALYQSNYDPENPGYSGIQAVKDPGLGLVYVGFTMMSLGVIFIFYVRPKLVEAARKRQEVRHAA